ncbi:MAG TPA: nucleotidyltransferase family protein [Agriterribacter sp.]|nr:nucleotidyltransferase family protein [Agriterribacter sp.]
MNAQQQPGLINTGMVILAAGSSTRFGKIKQLLHFNGKTLLQHAIDEAAAAGITPIVIVTGAHAEEVSMAIKNEHVTIAFNEHWQKGMASGIVAGLKKLIMVDRNIEKVIIAVCDQPFVTSALFTQLYQTQSESTQHIAACVYADTIGTPVLFTKKYFEALLGLTGDEGAKKILKLNPEDVARVDFPQGAVDIDTQKDYEDLIDRQRHVF